MNGHGLPTRKKITTRNIENTKARYGEDDNFGSRLTCFEAVLFPMIALFQMIGVRRIRRGTFSCRDFRADRDLTSSGC